MAVDDADLQLDFSPNNHAFNIHSVQYLSKDNGKLIKKIIQKLNLSMIVKQCHDMVREIVRSIVIVISLKILLLPTH